MYFPVFSLFPAIFPGLGILMFGNLQEFYGRQMINTMCRVHTDFRSLSSAKHSNCSAALTASTISSGSGLVPSGLTKGEAAEVAAVSDKETDSEYQPLS